MIIGAPQVASILAISLVLAPHLTLISLLPTLITAALTRNLVAGVGVGFLFFNGVAVATTRDTAQIALCLFLTALATATYVVATWWQIATAIQKPHPFAGYFTENTGIPEVLGQEEVA